ncbi:unnamed protein product [Heligmosomoides polygyrus]|uniref:MATH domain-containing protein n=1 Tax=Heligmosomoides polygyrus TaxID=6339 RepID=A0A183GJH5_HELPZ|nr:unnamed protein product [Heligmosomoides polygyrus]
MGGEEPAPAQHQPMPEKAISAATTVDIRAENVAEVVSVEVKSWNSVKRTKDPFDPPGVQFSKYGWKRIANDGPPSNGDMFHVSHCLLSIYVITFFPSRSPSDTVS